MIIEISRVLIQKSKIEIPIEIDLLEPCSIKSLIERLNLENMGYAVFFVNGKEVKKGHILSNEDNLRILPIFGGG
jgi:sulfur carrier protein ThiS